MTETRDTRRQAIVLGPNALQTGFLLLALASGQGSGTSSTARQGGSALGIAILATLRLNGVSRDREEQLRAQAISAS